MSTLSKLSIHLNSAIAQTSHPSTGTEKAIASVPIFYQTKNLSIIGHAAKEAIISEIRNIKRDQILSNDELDMVWNEFSSHSATNDEGEKVISYSTFTDIKRNIVGKSSKFERFLNASVFSTFQRDKNGDVSTVSLLQARLDLSYYDAGNEGYLKEEVKILFNMEELQNYILESMPSLNLQDFNPSFNKFYLCCAVRKFMFFLDPLKRGRIAIKSILLSPILTEMYELRDPNLPREMETQNWFSGHSCMRVYGMFLALDTDRNGMLSRKELGNYNKGVLSNYFLDRLFQECLTYGGEMDFKSFIDFVLAMENMYSEQSIAFCFKLLDYKSQRYLDEMTIRQFLIDLSKKMHIIGSEPLPVEDVLNEIFDMANPQDPDKITLNDLLNCGVGGTILNILIDCRGFHSHDGREVMESV